MFERVKYLSCLGGIPKRGVLEDTNFGGIPFRRTKKGFLIGEESL